MRGTSRLRGRERWRPLTYPAILRPDHPSPPLSRVPRWIARASLALALLLAPAGAVAQGAPPIRWSHDGVPSPAVAQALDLLRGASAYGLNRRDYAADSLAALADQLGRDPSEPRRAAFERRLTRAVLDFLRHVHAGRVAPSALGYKFRLARGPDYRALLAAYVDAGAPLGGLVAALEPQMAEYRVLKDALGRYRTLAADTALPRLPPLPRGTAAVRLGEGWTGLPALRRRLAAMGDLDTTGIAVADTTYDPLLAEAVRRFQERHGLEPDGVLGRGTLAAAATPFLARARQLELALERLRWLPHLGTGAGIAVNIPSFTLTAYDSMAVGAVPAFRMRVIVGRALDTETPVFTGLLRRVEFRPYWNVPRSITTKEIVPDLRKDPAYLRKQDMELVDRRGRVVAADPAAEATLQQLLDGELRVRQRPGPNNSVGLVKFVFPNTDAIYLHGTPSPQLFARTRRDFSHGCVRVEDPAGLAAWVLQDGGAWPRARIDSVLADTVSLAAPVERRIPVLLYYTTAAAGPDGRVSFFADVYGHDRRLARALAGLPIEPPAAADTARPGA